MGSPNAATAILETTRNYADATAVDRINQFIRPCSGGLWIYFGLGEYVKKVSGLNSIYQLGHILGQFTNLLNQPRTTYADIAPGCAMIWAQLGEMLKGIPIPFESTGRVMKEFVQMLDVLKDKLSPASFMTPIAGTMDLYRMNDLVTRLQVQMAQELDAMPIWFVTKRRAYSIDDLIENAERVFDPDTILLLSPRTTLDIRQAGRAIAFEVPTAAGFHADRKSVV